MRSRGIYGVVGAAPQNLAAARRSILPKGYYQLADQLFGNHGPVLMRSIYSPKSLARGRFHSLGPDAISLLGKVQAVGHHIF